MTTNRLMTFSDSTHPVLTCRSQHQQWASSLHQSEEEIDQLLSLLTDLPAQISFLDLQQQTVQYAAALSRLKNHIHQLQVDVVCAGAGCSAQTTDAKCPDVRFTPQPAEVPLFPSLSAEVNRMKERCQAFLGKLVGLNLI
ncbi:hypothetical protein [Rudanella lutea]|uniref:hypothetical protein n=1 Tax=Rudanella lutea TaxID=451374 RepID=UPI0005C6C08C|nr:hypothetical protein [Rudanella lutea]